MSIVKNLNELNEFAEKIFKLYKDKNQIALYGDLGSGKTAFTNLYLKNFGIKENITSPTFNIIKTYNPLETKYNNIYHIDCYRLENIEELIELGFKEYSNDEKSLVIIEWSEKVEEILADNRLELHFKISKNNNRKIIVKNYNAS